MTKTDDRPIISEDELNHLRIHFRNNDWRFLGRVDIRQIFGWSNIKIEAGVKALMHEGLVKGYENRRWRYEPAPVRTKKEEPEPMQVTQALPAPPPIRQKWDPLPEPDKDAKIEDWILHIMSLTKPGEGLLTQEIADMIKKHPGSVGVAAGVLFQKGLLYRRSVPRIGKKGGASFRYFYGTDPEPGRSPGMRPRAMPSRNGSMTQPSSNGFGASAHSAPPAVQPQPEPSRSITPPEGSDAHFVEINMAKFKALPNPPGATPYLLSIIQRHNDIALMLHNMAPLLEEFEALQRIIEIYERPHANP